MNHVRFTSVCAALAFMLIAGSARAQFDECVLPSDVPELVFETILDQASFDFGEVSEKACKAIVKTGVSTCKAQVNTAAKCFRKSFDTNYSIAIKQCNELEDSGERADCKAGFKANRDDQRGEIDTSKQTGLSTCDDDFEEALSDACLGVLKM